MGHSADRLCSAFGISREAQVSQSIYKFLDALCSFQIIEMSHKYGHAYEILVLIHCLIRDFTACIYKAGISGLEIS